VLGSGLARTIKSIAPVGSGALQVELVPSVLDLGKVQRGTDVTATVKIVNNGPEPVALAHVGSNCGCTVAERPQNPIQPGEAAAIAVRMSASDIVGRITEKRLTFTFEGSLEQLTLPVSCTSAEFVRLSSPLLDPKSSEPQVLAIDAFDDYSFRIASVEPEVLDGRVDHALTHHELHFSREKWFALGEPRSVTLRLEHPEVEELVVKIGTPRVRSVATPAGSASGSTVPDTLQLSPQRISFGELSAGGASAPVSVFLRGLNVAAPSDVVVTSDVTGINCAVLEVSAADGGTDATLQLTAVQAAAMHTMGPVELRLTVRCGNRSGSVTGYATLVPEIAGGG
jgi:hypothetical protein